jgi:hypothetical protein
MYIVLKQFIPGNDQIWVAKLDLNDPEYIYPTEDEAINQALLLQNEDTSSRQYKVALYNQQT